MTRQGQKAIFGAYRTASLSLERGENFAILAHLFRSSRLIQRHSHSLCSSPFMQPLSLQGVVRDLCSRIRPIPRNSSSVLGTPDAIEERLVIRVSSAPYNCLAPSNLILRLMTKPALYHTEPTRVYSCLAIPLSPYYLCAITYTLYRLLLSCLTRDQRRPAQIYDILTVSGICLRHWPWPTEELRPDRISRAVGQHAGFHSHHTELDSSCDRPEP